MLFYKLYMQHQLLLVVCTPTTTAVRSYVYRRYKLLQKGVAIMIPLIRNLRQATCTSIKMTRVSSNIPLLSHFLSRHPAADLKLHTIVL
jgi:hypothetical protein